MWEMAFPSPRNSWLRHSLFAPPPHPKHSTLSLTCVIKSMGQFVSKDMTNCAVAQSSEKRYNLDLIFISEKRLYIHLE
jgi:hypothetical protein